MTRNDRSLCALRHPVLAKCIEDVEKAAALYRALPTDHNRYQVARAKQRARSVLVQLLK